MDDDRNGLGGDEGGKVGLVRHHEDEGNEKDEAGDGVEEDGGDHGFGHLRGRLSYFLAHGDDHSGGRSSVGGVEETDAKGPSCRPSRVTGVEFTEYVGGFMAAVSGNGEHTDDDTDQAGKGPEDSEGVEPGQPFVAQCGHGVAQKGDGKEDEVDLVGFGGEDADFRLGFEDVDARDKEQGCAKVYSKSDGYVADDESPATNPGHDQSIGRRGKHKGLIVHAA